jgi:hypothetical protein
MKAFLLDDGNGLALIDGILRNGDAAGEAPTSRPDTLGSGTTLAVAVPQSLAVATAIPIDMLFPLLLLRIFSPRD